MRNHIYLNCALTSLRKLRDDINFEAAFEYEPIEAKPKLFQHEYGRIKTAQNYYHVLAGNPPQENCPWCNGPGEMIQLKTSDLTSHSVYCIQCMQCGARGPSLNVSKDMEINKTCFNECIALLWQRWKNRRTWHDGFVNPYEVVDELD